MNNNDNEVLFNEAPASWNTRYINPDGFECQLTIRGEKGAEVLEKANAAIAHLLKNDCIPYSFYQSKYGPSKAQTKSDGRKNGKDSTPAAGNNHDEAWCPIHECEMKRWDKNGRVWYSHKVNGEWCKG